MKIAAALAALFLLGASGSPSHAAPPSQTVAVPVANQPWMASEKDVVGQWIWGAGTDAGWEASFHADHTVTAFFNGLVGMGPIASTWTLKNNHVLVDDAPFVKFFGASLPKKNYPATPFHKYPIEPNFGSNLQVICYQGSVVLYSTAEEADVQKYGPVPWFCFWQYEHTKKGYALPPAAMKLEKHVLEIKEAGAGQAPLIRHGFPHSAPAVIHEKPFRSLYLSISYSDCTHWRDKKESPAPQM